MSETIKASKQNENEDFEINRQKTKKALPALLIVFLLGTLMIQAFNLVFQNIGDSLGMSSSASLISTLPGIVLGVVCMLYGTLCDFISPKKMTIFGVVTLIVGSLAGFILSFNFWAVLIARMVQVAGAQVAGSVFLIMTVKYLNEKEKAIYLGIFNAVYYLAAAFGVFAGGFITSFDWKYLFLVPVISIFFVPLLFRNTPDISMKGEKIDVLGITIFAVIAGLIAIYFSYPSIWLILAILILTVCFALYIAKGKNPFLSKSFITNGRYMSILLFWFVICLFNFACVPIYNVIGDSIYHIPLTQVSLYLTLIYLVATLVGCVSGPLINRFGRSKTIILAGALCFIGFFGSALLVRSGFWILTIFACLFVAGMTAIYTPVYDAASDALPVEENGRGIGICDLILNTSASIGMAIYSNLMANKGFGGHAVIGHATGETAAVINMFLIMAAVSVVAMIIFFIFRKNFAAQRE